MLERDPEVLVIGAGPAGSIAARVAAESGADTVLLDKKFDLTRSSACGGLVSLSTWKKLGAADRTVVNEVRGVLVHPPDGSDFELSSPQVKSYVIDRDKLNADLLSRAKDEGVLVHPETQIFRRNGSAVGVRSIRGSKDWEVSPEVIIGADGPRSDVRRLFGLERPSKLLYAIQAEMEMRPFREDYVEVFFGREIAPGFFGWVIPVSGEVARVGLATHEGKGLRQFFDRLLDAVGGVKEEPEEFRTGVIPIGVPDHSSRGSVLTVGDAAGQVKPTTGGGLYPISITSRLAGEVAVKALSGLEDPAGYYYREWMDRVGKELSREMLLHRVLVKVSDRKLSRLLGLLNRPKIADWVAENGDIDHLYPLAKKMAKNPLVMGTVVKALPGELGAKLKDELR